MAPHPGDVFGYPCAILKNTEGAAYGAALLAMTGTGQFATVPEACQHCIAIAEEVPVNGPDHARYEKSYATYVSLYPALRDSMHRLGTLEREFARQD